MKAAAAQPPTSFTIRPVAADEYEAVADMTVSVYAAVLGGHLSDAYRAHLADVAHRAANSLVLVAVRPHDGALLGNISYVPGPGPYAEFDSPDEAGIRMLAVAPHAERRGVGTALVQECVDQARRAGKARISLHTTPQMTGAHRLYERLGFRRAPERDWEPEPSVNLLGYVLDLGVRKP